MGALAWGHFQEGCIGMRGASVGKMRPPPPRRRGRGITRGVIKYMLALWGRLWNGFGLLVLWYKTVMNNIFGEVNLRSNTWPVPTLAIA